MDAKLLLKNSSAKKKRLEMYEDRVEKAEKLFMEGYNCAQSVTLAFADLYGLTSDQALKISASFGGGMGRMRLTCGAVSGMMILVGLETGSVNPKSREEKVYNYSVVRTLAAKFKAENGSVVCGDLLGLNGPSDSAAPSERTPEYYHKRPCPELVRCAAKIFADFLETRKKL